MRTPTPHDPIRVRVWSGDHSKELGLGYYTHDETVYAAMTPDMQLITNGDGSSPPDLKSLPPGSKLIPPSKSPSITLDSGRTISGAQCWWEPVDKADAERPTKPSPDDVSDDDRGIEASNLSAEYAKAIGTLRKEMGIPEKLTDAEHGGTREEHQALCDWSMGCMADMVVAVSLSQGLKPDQANNLLEAMWSLMVQSAKRLKQGHKLAGFGFDDFGCDENGVPTHKSTYKPVSGGFPKYPNYPTEWQRKNETLSELLDRMEAVDPMYHGTPEMFQDAKQASHLLKEAIRKNGDHEMRIEIGRLRDLQNKMSKAISD